MTTYEAIIEMKDLLMERPFEVLNRAFKGNKVAIAMLAPNGVYAAKLRLGVPYGEFPLPETAKAIQAYEEGATFFQVWTETNGVFTTLTVNPVKGEYTPSGPKRKFLAQWLLKAID